MKRPGDGDVKKICNIHLFINYRIFIEQGQKSVTDAEKFKLDEQVLFISLINLIV